MATAMKQKMRTNYSNSLSSQGKNKQRGFTLIEIAIVLVIIGLLLGGVLKGQELINTARVRALNNTVDGITAAWFSFQDRYRAYPGDYSKAEVNLPDPTGIAGTIVKNGDGNGRVGIVGTAYDAAESANVWVQLQAAGYITATFDGDATGLAADTYNCSIDTCPDNGFGAGMNLNFGTQILGATDTTPDAHELMTGLGIPVEVLAELDRKVDDGEPTSGSMQVGIGGTGGWTTTESAACVTTAGTPAVTSYGIQNPSSNCAAVFRNF